MALVRTSGFSALSVRGVAKEAGVGASTLRHHFPTQAHLHRVIATELVLGLVKDLTIDDDKLDPADRLFDCLLQFLPPPAQNEQAAALNSWFELYRLSFGPDAAPAFRGVLTSAHEASTTVLHRWLKTLARQGHVQEDDIDDHAAYALAMINGLHLCMLVEPRRFDLSLEHRVLRHYVNSVVERSAGKLVTPEAQGAAPVL